MEVTKASSADAETPALNVLSDQGTEALKDIAFGSAGGIVGKYIEYPFDTVKVRLQSQPDHLPLRYTGPLDCFKQSLRNEGFSGLYRGVSAPLVGAAIETSSLFFSYRLAQDFVRMTILPNADPLPLTALVACGGMSGASTSLLLTPIELVKCRMQVPLSASSHTVQLPGVFSTIASVYRQRGWLGFWHGQLGTLIRETGGSAAWFGSNEAVSLAFRKMRHAKSSSMSSTDKEPALPLWQQMTAGAVAGMSYNFIFYPADTIKSRMQTEDFDGAASSRAKFFDVGKAIWRQHGLKGLYRGCGITVGRAAPSSAVIFTIYESLKRHFA